MNLLSLTLIFKIALTLAFWSLPLIFVPKKYISALGFPDIRPILFLRLLGVANFALVVGYSAALMVLLADMQPGAAHFPHDTIWVGIVSNGGATLVLAFYGFRGSWSQWEKTARLSMWLSLTLLSLITVSLIINGVVRVR